MGNRKSLGKWLRYHCEEWTHLGRAKRQRIRLKATIVDEARMMQVCMKVVSEEAEVTRSYE